MNPNQALWENQPVNAKRREETRRLKVPELNIRLAIRFRPIA